VATDSFERHIEKSYWFERQRRFHHHLDTREDWEIARLLAPKRHAWPFCRLAENRERLDLGHQFEHKKVDTGIDKSQSNRLC
jgi:hypothetical protein